MAKQLNIDLNVKANAEQAKAEFQSLQKALSDVAVSASKTGQLKINTSQFKEASKAAQELQRHLNNAVDINTGKLNLNKLNTSLKQSKANIGDLSGKLLSVQGAGEQAFVKLAQSIATADRPLVSMGTRLNGLLTTLKNTARWQISSTILHGFMGSISKAYNYAKDLNKSLNDIRIVTGQNTSQMAKFAEAANKSAKELSTTTTAYTKASLIYYQQGLSDEEVKKRTDTTIKLANVSRQSAEDVSSQMTAIWNNFAKDGENLEYYADVITKLGASTASSSSEIAEGMSKFASVADTVGLSYDKAAASVATVVAETRQSADVVGTAFKTMFARIEGLKLGETLEDGVDLNKYSEALKTIGVNILDANKQVKDMDTILDEVGKRWNAIGESEKIAVSEAVAGTRQYTQFMALMNNYDKVQENQSLASGSGGTLQKQADIYAESWDAASKRVQASLESVYQAILDDGFFIAMANSFATLLEGINQFIKGIGGIGPLMLGISALFLQSISNKIMPALNNLKISLVTMFQSPTQQAKTYGKLMEDILNQAKKQVGFNGESLSTSAKVAIEYADKLSIAKNKLMSMDKKLTDQEKAQAQAGLDLIAIYQKEVQAIADKITKEEEDITTMMDQRATEQAKKDVKQSRSFNLDALKGELEEAKALLNSFKFDNLGNLIEGDYQGFFQASEMVQQLTQDLNDYKQETNKLAYAKEDLIQKTRLGYEEFLKTGQATIDLTTEVQRLETNFTELGNKSEFTAKDIASISEQLELLETLDLNAFEQIGTPMQTVTQAITEYSQVMSNSKSTDDEKSNATNNLKQALSGLGTILEGTAENGNRCIISFNKLGKSENEATAEAKKFRAAMDGLNDTKFANKLENAYTKLNKDAKQLDAAQQKVNEAFNNFNPTHMMTGVEAVSKMASAGMSAAMVMQSVRSAIEAFNNDDLDIGQKITTGLMSVGMIVPSVISSFNGIKAVIDGLKNAYAGYIITQKVSTALSAIEEVTNSSSIITIGEKTAATLASASAEALNLTEEQQSLATQAIEIAAKKQNNKLTKEQIGLILAKAAATNVEAGTTDAATIAQQGLNTMMEANPIGAIIAAIVAVIAVLGAFIAITVAVANAKSEEEKAVKKANEQLEISKKRAEEAKSAYEDLKGKITDYKSVVDALSQYAKGTKEWSEAFQNVLNKVNELIQKYPSLLSYSNLFNSDGTFNTDVLEQAEKDFQNSSLDANSKVLKDTAELYKAEYELTRKQTADKIQEKTDVTVDDSSINKIIDNLSNKNINFNQKNNKEIRKEVEQILSKSSDLSTTELQSNVDKVTNTITTLSTDFTTLSTESQKTATAFSNAQKIVAQNYYSDSELDTNNVADLAAGELALSTAGTENNKKVDTDINKAINSWMDNNTSNNASTVNFVRGLVGYDIEDNATLEYYAKLYNAAIPDTDYNLDHTWTRKDSNDNDETTFVFKYTKDGKKEEQKVSAADLIDTVGAYLTRQDKENVTNEKNQLADKFKNKSTVGLSYLTSYDLSSATIEDINNFNKNPEKNNPFKNGDLNNKYLKRIIANRDYKGEVSKVTEEDLKKEKNIVKIQADKANDTIKENSDYISKEILNSLDFGSLPKVSEMYTKAMAKEGKRGTDVLDSIGTRAGKESGKVLKALSEIDLSTADTTKINKQFKDLGLQFQLSATDVYNLKDALLQTTSVTAESAKETYKSISKVLTNLKKTGDTIEDEDYTKLVTLNPAIESCFTTLVDGTHMLTGEVQDFKTAMQTASMNQLYQAHNGKLESAAAYDYLNSDTGKGYTKTSNMSDFKETDKDGKKTYSIGGNEKSNWEKYSEQIEAQLQVLKDQGKTDIAEKYEAKINDKKDTKGEIEDYKGLNEVIAGVAKSYEDLALKNDDLKTSSQEAAKEAKKLAEAIEETAYQNKVANANLDYETTENYADILLELYENQGLTKESARELAIANQRLDRGLSSLNENFQTWQNTLKKTNKASAEYASTIGKLRKDFADLLNIADGKELSTTWIEKWVNDSASMEQILNGNTQALQRFRESAFTEMTTNIFTDMKESLTDLIDTATDDDYKKDMQELLNVLNDGTFSAANLRSAIQDLSGSEIGAGAKLSKEYVDSLNEMLAQGLLTEQQMNDMFSTIGYKPKVTTKNVNQWVEVPIYQTFTSDAGTVSESDTDDIAKGVSASNTKSKITWTKQIGTKRMKQSVPVIQIDSDKTAGGNLEIVNAGSQNITPSYGSTTSGKEDTGNKTTSAASQTHTVNRYSKEESAIKGLSKQYSRLNKLKDQAYGYNRVAMMELELKKLKEINKVNKESLKLMAGKDGDKKVAQAYQKGTLGKMIASGKVGGYIGKDYKSLFGGKSASGKGLEYTSKDSKGNEKLTRSNYSLKEFNSMFGTNIKFNLDNFGNISNKDNLLKQIENLSNAEERAYKSHANPTAASTTDYNKRKAYLEELKERITQYGDTAEKLGEKQEEYLNNISEQQEKNAQIITTRMNTGVEIGKNSLARIERTMKLLGDDIYTSIGAMNKWWKSFDQKRTALSKQDDAYQAGFKDIKKGVERYNKKGGEMDDKAISPDKAIEALKTIEDGYADMADMILTEIETKREHFGNTLEKWKSKIEEVTTSIANNAKTLEHYQKVLQLLGRSTDYQSLGTVLKGQLKVAEDDYDVKKARNKQSKKTYDKAQAEYNAMKNDKNVDKKELAEFKKNTLDKAKKDYEETLADKQASLEAVLEKINAVFENEVNRIFQESENSLTGKWGSFDALDSAMKRQQSVAEEYLTKTNQIYETNKMLRTLQKDIDKTDSSIAKTKLKGFENEIKAMQKKEKLTKTDLKIAQARYEILKAQIALEEAQNAKSTVRLKRDSEGNYGYVYTANQDKVSDAEQDLADKKNALYNVGLETAQEYAQKLISIRKEMNAELQDAALKYQNGEIESKEEYERIVADITKKYKELELVYTENYNAANLVLNEEGAQGQTEAWTNSFKDIIEDHKIFKTNSKSIANQTTAAINKAMKEMDDKRKHYSREARVGNRQLKKSNKGVEDSNNDLKEAVDDVTTSVNKLKIEAIGKDGKGGLVGAMGKTLNKSLKLTAEFSKNYTELKNLAKKYTTAANNANTYATSLLALTKQQKAYNKAVKNQPDPKPQTPSPSTDNNNTGNYSNIGNSNTQQPQIYNPPSDEKKKKTKTKKFPTEGIYYRLQSNGPFFRVKAGDGHAIAISKWLSEGKLNPGNLSTIQLKGYSGFIRYFKGLNGITYYTSDDNIKTNHMSGEFTNAGFKSFDTGGYTGKWDSNNGKLAFLHQKELVLNAVDTENLLAAVKLIREINQSIDLQAMAQGTNFQMAPVTPNEKGQTIQQEVTIHAEFPNANNHLEIEEAFNSLVNKASQYANRN